MEDIDLEKAIVGTKVFYVPMYERTKLVPVEELRKKKYTDASNAFDEEISEGVSYNNTGSNDIMYNNNNTKAVNFFFFSKIILIGN